MLSPKALESGKIVQRLKKVRKDSIVRQVQIDIINGLLYSDIKEKFAEGLYEGQRKNLASCTVNSYIKEALEEIRLDKEEDIEQLRANLSSQYYSIYQQAISDRNDILAKQTLDSISKYLLPPSEKKVYVDTNDDKICIKFDFSNSKDDDEENEGEE